MSKGTEAFNNILAEGDFRYFSSLYDRDMFREDVITVKKELEALDIIKRYYYGNGVLFGEMKQAELKFLSEVLK